MRLGGLPGGACAGAAEAQPGAGCSLAGRSCGRGCGCSSAAGCLRTAVKPQGLERPASPNNKPGQLIAQDSSEQAEAYREARRAGS